MPSFHLFTQRLCAEGVCVLVWEEKELWSQHRSSVASVTYFSCDIWLISKTLQAHI